MVNDNTLCTACGFVRRAHSIEPPYDLFHVCPGFSYVRPDKYEDLDKLTDEQLVSAVLGPDGEFQGVFAKTHRTEILRRLVAVGDLKKVCAELQNKLNQAYEDLDCHINRLGGSGGVTR